MNMCIYMYIKSFLLLSLTQVETALMRYVCVCLTCCLELKPDVMVSDSLQCMQHSLLHSAWETPASSVNESISPLINFVINCTICKPIIAYNFSEIM